MLFRQWFLKKREGAIKNILYTGVSLPTPKIQTFIYLIKVGKKSTCFLQKVLSQRARVSHKAVSINSLVFLS